MPACTFFGHRDFPGSYNEKLKEAILELIDKGVDRFYVGNQGNFDLAAARILKKIAAQDPSVDYCVVLAYYSSKKQEYEIEHPTLLPEGIEEVFKKFAISWRNEWMLDKCEYVITYITKDFGGAARFAAKAEKQKKTVINIAKNDRSCGEG